MKKTRMLVAGAVGALVIASLSSCLAPVTYEGKYSSTYWDGERLIITPKPRAIEALAAEKEEITVLPTK